MTRQQQQPCIDEDRYCSATELGAFLSVSPRTINRWRRLKLIPAHRLPSGGFRYDAVEVEGVLQHTWEDGR